jgi:osmotically-inducible protein OsmY
VRGTAHDIGARTRGAMHELRARRNEHGDVPDDILAERVRAQIGRPVSTPGALEIEVHDGLVEVRGTIPPREADPLLRTVRRVRGVRDVVDRLERHEPSGHTPSLQGSGNGEAG